MTRPQRSFTRANKVEASPEGAAADLGLNLETDVAATKLAAFPLGPVRAGPYAAVASARHETSD